MARSISTKLFSVYALVLSLLFVLFIALILWGMKFTYYTSIEHTLQDTVSKIEKNIIEAHYLIDKNKIVENVDTFLGVEIYEYKKGKYIPVLGHNHDTVVKEEYPKNGFSIKNIHKDDKQISYAHYSRIFKVYPHEYYIHISTQLYGFPALQHQFLYFLFALSILLYLFVLYLGYRNVKRVMHPIHKMIQITSDIDNQNMKRRLELPSERDEFYLLSDTINGMLERLEKTLDRTKRFNAKVSHELRTPLTIIRGEIEVALFKERSPSEYRELLYSTLEEIDTLQSITDNMLLLTKLDSELRHIKKMHVRLDKLLEEVTDALKIQSEAKSIKIVLKTDRVSLYAEKILMLQAIKNMIHNAIKYSPDNTIIHISLMKNTHEGILLEIKDQGYGIAEEDIAHICEPRYRSDSIDRIAEGGRPWTCDCVSCAADT